MSKTQNARVPLNPLGDRVLLQDLSEKDTERKLASGLILPASVKDEGSGAKKAKVIAVGEGRLKKDGVTRIPVSVSIGDIVLFSWGDNLKIDGVEYHVVQESNILGIVNK